MFEELKGKKVKCVWQDGETSKAVTGILTISNKTFLTIIGDEDKKPINIFVNSLVTLKER